MRTIKTLISIAALAAAIAPLAASADDYAPISFDNVNSATGQVARPFPKTMYEWQEYWNAVLPQPGN